MFKKKKQAVPHWFEVIQEEIKNARTSGKNYCYGYAPVGQEKLLMSLPNDISFTLEMRVEHDNGADYFYKFNF